MRSVVQDAVPVRYEAERGHGLIVEIGINEHDLVHP